MPTLTPHADDDPTPRVEILFDEAEWASGTATVNVLQVSDEGTLIVRNGTGMEASGGVYLIDYEIPPGIPVSYQAEMFNSSGASLGLSAAASTQVDLPLDVVIFQDPLAPKTSVRVQAQRSFGGTLTQSRDSTLYRAGDNTIALMGPLGLYEDVDLSVRTNDQAIGVTLLEVLQVGALLVRTMPIYQLPSLLYVNVAKPGRTLLNARFGGFETEWSLSGDQVSRNLVDILQAVITYARYKAYFATYADAKAVYSTYLDAKKNPPPEA